MLNIRIKITVKLNREHAIREADLTHLKPFIARGVAGCLPEEFRIDTVDVTSIKEAAPQPRPTSATA